MQQEYEALRARGAQLVAIGQGTAEEAQRFCRQLGVAYPCLGDPEKDSYRTFGLPRGGLREILFEPIRAGNQAVRRGHKVSVRGALMRHSDWFQLPGVAIVDRAGILRYLYRSRHSGDLPPMSAVRAALEASLAV
jgi:hypothetical protein